MVFDTQCAMRAELWNIQNVRSHTPSTGYFSELLVSVHMPTFYWFDFIEDEPYRRSNSTSPL